MLLVAGALLIIVSGPGFIRHMFTRNRQPVLYGIFFIALGLGFMLLEIALIQQNTLFLGKPVFSLSVLLFTLLISGALGSYISSHIRLPDKRKITLSIVALLILTTVQITVTPSLFGVYLGEGLATRIAVTIAWLLPLGFFMGIPFPSAIRLANRIGLSNQIPLVRKGSLTAHNKLGVLYIRVAAGFMSAGSIAASPGGRQAPATRGAASIFFTNLIHGFLTQRKGRLVPCHRSMSPVIGS